MLSYYAGLSIEKKNWFLTTSNAFFKDIIEYALWILLLYTKHAAAFIEKKVDRHE